MPPHAQLTSLPAELHDLVLSHLSNCERKCLRLACSHLRDKTPLHITRVFLSANERNVDVFRAIANHDLYRAQITELIWDDAILPTHGDSPEDVEDYEDYDPQYEPEDFFERYGLADPEASPIRFVRGCESNLTGISGRQHDYHEHPTHYSTTLPQYRDRDRQAEEQLPFPVSYAYYQGLLMQQDRVLATQADVAALAYGLARFPALRRITVTAAAHGLLYEPLYPTPMIRAFPWGFNYPIPRGWPMRSNASSTPVRAPPWDKAHKARWRGVSAVLHALAAARDQPHGVSELVVDAHGLPTGLNWRLFDDPACEAYRDLAAFVRPPGFRHLDLALLVAWEQWGADRPPFRSGHLRRLLEGAGGLEHVRLGTDLTPNQEDFGMSFDDLAPPPEGDGLRLRDLCPVERWPRLRHLGLNGFHLFQSDLVALLAALPPSLRSVDLCNLRFVGGGSYRSLLCDMRERLDWRDRRALERPRVAIAVGNQEGLYTGIERVICVEDEVGGFLYDDGPNPFGREPERWPDRIREGFGVERDGFDPSFEKPWGVWER